MQSEKKNKKITYSPPDDKEKTGNANSELEELIDRLRINNEALMKIIRYFGEKNMK